MALSFFLCGSFLNTRGTPGTRTARSSSKHIDTTRYLSTFHVNLVKLHHTYTRDPACGGQARLVCLSNGVLLHVSEFSRYLINYSTIKHVNLKDKLD